MRRYSRAEGRAEGRVEGRAEGEAIGKRRIAKDMLAGGVPREFIQKYLKLSAAELDRLAEETEE